MRGLDSSCSRMKRNETFHYQSYNCKTSSVGRNYLGDRCNRIHDTPFVYIILSGDINNLIVIDDGTLRGSGTTELCTIQPFNQRIGDCHITLIRTNHLIKVYYEVSGFGEGRTSKRERI